MPETSAVLSVADIAKNFGSVRALSAAALDIRAGEVHALMGANGAGKSTLVKIITGVFSADGGTVTLNGTPRSFRSPAEARAAGIVSVYQDPALVPDLTVAQNMRLARVAMPEVRRWLDELGIRNLDDRAMARELPYATLRLIDLARALASNPVILLLDEITAALPADLAAQVFKIVRAWRDAGKSVIFISHRMAEVSSLCDRATVLRDGKTVGVVEMATKGSDDRIVSLMLGAEIAKRAAAATTASGSNRIAKFDGPAALEVTGLAYGHALNGVSFTLRRGEVLGVSALEGQGQQELFDCIAGVRRYDKGSIIADGAELKPRHPADAIRAGVVLIPANRVEALLPQRSIAENTALAGFGRLSSWGPIAMGAERAKVGEAVQRLQIDTRAESELKRLSGGNQQKVVIARWLAAGFKTLLCFDPTRGIDIGTKRQIYALVRELAASGNGVLLFTSETPEIALACDRVIVLYAGRIVHEMPAAQADEASLLRAAHGLTTQGSELQTAAPAATPHPNPPPQGGRGFERRVGATEVPQQQTAPSPLEGEGRGGGYGLGDGGAENIEFPAATPALTKFTNLVWRNAALFAMPALLLAAMIFTVIIHPGYGSFELQSLALAALPLALAACAQSVVVISGGIDLSVGPMMSVANVFAGSLMVHGSFGAALLWSVLILIIGALEGLANGLLVRFSRIPDVVVTLTTGFILGGVALLIMERPGGGAPASFIDLAAGTYGSEWVPNALIFLVVAVAAVWTPIIRSRLGLLIYATGSDPIAAFRSGVDTDVARTMAYVISGIFSALGGIALTMTTGIGAPLSGGIYTLSGIAAVVIGGVSLTGGKGGIVGPVIAAILLSLIPADLIFLNIDPNYGQVIQGTLIVLVVMAGGLAAAWQARK